VRLLVWARRDLSPLLSARAVALPCGTKATGSPSKASYAKGRSPDKGGVAVQLRFEA
jgi:hypothetical protein